MNDLKRYVNLYSEEIDTIIDKDKLNDKYQNVKKLLLVSYYKLMKYLYRECPSDGIPRRDGKGPEEGGQGRNRRPFGNRQDRRGRNRRPYPRYDELENVLSRECPSDGIPRRDGKGPQEGGQGRNRKQLVKALSKYSLSISIKQIESKLLEACGVKDEKAMNEINSCNIIDNVFFLIPLALMANEDPLNIAQTLNHSNIVNSLDHKALLITSVYEKYNKKKIPVQSKKTFKKYLAIYEICKKRIAEYI